MEIEEEIRKSVKRHFTGDFWINRYGAYDIDPKNLVIWVCVKSDKDKEYLQSLSILKQEMMEVIVKSNYPKEAIPFISIGVESQETIDRESSGNWYSHFK